MNKRRTIIYGSLAVLTIISLALFVSNFKSGTVKGPEERTAVAQMGPSAKRAYLKGVDLYQFRQLRPAIEMFELALSFQPELEVARIKLASAKKDLEDVINENYVQGLHEFGSLHYDRAVRSWRRVMALVQDANDDRYKKADENIKLAKAKMSED